MKVKLLFTQDFSKKLLVVDARNMLFNILFAKHHHGHLYLRVDDTSEAPGDDVDPLGTIRWLGWEWEGSPCVEGDGTVPYYRSERLSLYRTYIDQLMDRGVAYRCFCSREILSDMFIQQRIRGQTPHYDGRCMRMALADIEAAIGEGMRCQVRLKTPEVVTGVHDIGRGRLVFDPQEVADLVIMRFDGSASSALANVVDHNELGITHVMRGDRTKAETVREAFLNQAFEFTTPKYVHIPLLLGEDRTLLSERHGDQFIEDFRDRGFLPEALLSYLAHQGMNPGPEDHLRSLGALTKSFKVEGIFRDPTVWQQEKLEVFNRMALERYRDDALAEMVAPYIAEMGFDLFSRGESWARLFVAAIRPGLNTLSDVKDFADIFFSNNVTPNKKGQTLLKEADAKKVVDALQASLREVDAVTHENYREILDAARSKVTSKGKALVMVRVALTGRDVGPEFSKLLPLLGRDTMLARLEYVRRYVPRGSKRD